MNRKIHLAMLLIFLFFAQSIPAGADTATAQNPQVISFTINGGSQTAGSYVQGDHITLAWSSSNATSCTATGSWSGTKTTSGSENVVLYSVGYANYSIYCSDGNGNQGTSVSLTPFVGAMGQQLKNGNLSVVSASVVSKVSDNTLITTVFNQTPSVAMIVFYEQLGTPAPPVAAVSIFHPASAISGSTVSFQISGMAPLKPDTDYGFTITAQSGTTPNKDVVSYVYVGDFKTEKSGKTGPITVNLKASKNVVGEGESVTLSWNAINADTCTASGEGDWSGSKDPVSGSGVVVPKIITIAGTSTASNQYTLTCSNASAKQQATVFVGVSSHTVQPTISSFMVDKLFAASGDAVTLSWQTDAERCTSAAFYLGSSGDFDEFDEQPHEWFSTERNPSGSQIVHPTVTTRYMLNCSNREKQDSRFVAVIVDNKKPALRGPALSVSAVKTYSQNDPTTRYFSYTYGNPPSRRELLIQVFTFSKKITKQVIMQKWIPTDTKGLSEGATSVSGFDPNTEYHYTLDLEDPFDGRLAHTEGDFKTDAIISPQKMTPQAKPAAPQQPKPQEDTVDQAAAPYLIFVRFPDIVTRGKVATLRWESDGDYCTASGSWQGKKVGIGMEKIHPNGNGTYYLQCFNNDGTSSDKEHVSTSVVRRLPKSQPKPIIHLSADKTSVSSGDSVTLSWNANPALDCEASGPDDWAGLQYASGSQNVSPDAGTQDYSLKCWNREGVSSSASVTVTANNAIQ